LISNYAQEIGGAIKNWGYCDIHYSNISNNTAEKWGGGLYNFQYSMNIFNSIVENNVARYGGGVHCDSNSQLTIKSSILRNNTANEGGAIKIAESEVTIKYATITNNIADFGGAIYSSGTLSVDNSNFLNNTANISSAIYIANDDYLIDNNYWGSNNPDFNKLLNINVSSNFSWIKIQTPTKIIASNLNYYYNKEKSLVITLKDDLGNNLINKNVSVSVNNKIHNLKTNSLGQVKINLKLNPNTYPVKIDFKGDEDYASSTTDLKITVKKAIPTIKASKKTFKIKTKTKKYTIILKDNLGKNIKNAKVYLKIKGKTYSAKTNSKGVGEFKIKLNKKGTFTVTIKYYGNKFFSSISKTVKITIKK